MNIEELRDHCLAVREAEECFPFGPDVATYKIMGKAFAFLELTPRNGTFKVDLKCDPERSIDLRERYHGVGRGHAGEQCLLWNGVTLDSDVPDDVIVELIEHSADQVISALPRYKRQEYLGEK